MHSYYYIQQYPSQPCVWTPPLVRACPFVSPEERVPSSNLVSLQLEQASSRVPIFYLPTRSRYLTQLFRTHSTPYYDRIHPNYLGSFSWVAEC